MKVRISVLVVALVVLVALVALRGGGQVSPLGQSFGRTVPEDPTAPR
jgi:hypothetical protein